MLKDQNCNLEYTFNGERKTLISQEISSLNWNITLFASEDLMYSPLKELRIRITLFVICTVIIFIILVYFIFRLFVKRIELVSSSLKEISEGEGDLTKSIAEESNDELTLLTKNFNQFLKLIHDMISKIKYSAGSTLNGSDD